MFSRFFKSTFFFILAISLSAHSTTVDLHRVAYAKHTYKPANTTSVSKSRQRSTIDLLLGQNSAAHLTQQNYRHTHVIKQSADFNQIVFASVSCLKYISRSSQLSFSRFRKLVLFPFHAFW
ncbi:hypothetical protein BDD43_2927 [Mucilaginibacter gracilis]|uniref:Uncharacterized protein n=1 Tax=Mucilaginibacter gracilis TaxID=423350 RepID=A0A495J205_9SPHI|nr:hypothetical protein [Mucilaginibacter gracilis]RKR82742.1 hypothetical protein BDD43_2927 [Mucilaginibacter gracilis]